MWKLLQRKATVRPAPPPRERPLHAIAQSNDYATRLRLLKSQHAALSAERTQLDHVGEQQRERVADLEARLRVLRCTLQLQTTAERQPDPLDLHEAPTHPMNCPRAVSSESPTAPFLREPPPPGPRDSPRWVSVPVPVEAYRSALAAAQHWHELAQELERELHSLSQLVRIDALTGLHNRRSFDEHLPRAVARSQRIGESVCLLMIDIDHFKRLNDTFGHPAGDAVLRSVAMNIAGCTRPSDHVARYGGEEFAVVLSDIDSAQAIAVAERIRRQVALAAHCPHPVTVSIGVAEYQPSHGGGHEALLADADRALYAAKHGGRDLVQPAPGRAAEDPPSAPE